MIKKTKNRIAIIVKTNINTDARVLNELFFLSKNLSDYDFFLYLMPDSLVNITLPQNVHLKVVSCKTRNKKGLRLFTALCLSLKIYRLVVKLDPTIIHLHDSASVLPYLFIRFFSGKSLKVIYDDHEIPNKTYNILKISNTILENYVINNANYVISANKERITYLQTKLKIKQKKWVVLQNYPLEKVMNNVNVKDLPENIYNDLIRLKELKKADKQLIMHQGPLWKERGAKEISTIIKNLSEDYIVVFLGVDKKQYISFLEKYNLEKYKTKICRIDKTSYKYIILFWRECIASIIFYKPRLVNNRYCAPNRLFLSLSLGMPVIVNRDNPVLKYFVDKYEAGAFVEEINFNKFLPENYKNRQMSQIINSIAANEYQSLLNVYKEVLFT